jgi:hypothetical protein
MLQPGRSTPSSADARAEREAVGGDRVTQQGGEGGAVGVGEVSGHR